MLKHQWFEDNDNEKRVSKVYKCRWINKNDNEKEDLDKYEGEVDGSVPIPLTLPPPPL